MVESSYILWKIVDHRNPKSKSGGMVGSIPLGVNFLFSFIIFSKLTGVGESYGGVRLCQLGPFPAISGMVAIDREVPEHVPCGRFAPF